MENRKKIAFITTSLRDGGAQRAISNISKGLDENKYDLYLILFDGSSRSYDSVGKIINLNIPATKNPFKKMYNFFIRYKKLRSIKMKYKFDTIVSFLHMPNILNVITGKHNSKLVLSIRAHISVKKKTIASRLNKLIIKKIYRKADLIVSVSEDIKTDMINGFKFDPKKIVVINNGYQIKDIKNLSEEPIENENKSLFNKYTIITSGRITFQKGNWILIQAFAKLLSSFPDAKLVILGEGEMKVKLLEMLNDLNISDKVHFLGFVTNPFKYFAASKIFVLTSLYEGFPNVLAEAMACGLPVISTDCLSGPREILYPNFLNKEIENYNMIGTYGILINRPAQSESLSANSNLITNLSKALFELLNDENQYRYYKNMASLRIKEYDMEKVILKWEKVL